MKILILLLFVFIKLTGSGQIQRFISYKNIITAKASGNSDPIVSFDTIRISFVPTTDRPYKTLIIHPDKGVKGIIACQLVNVHHVVSKGDNEIVYYDALQGNNKTDVIVTSVNDILVSISLAFNLSKGEVIKWTFTNIKPTFQRE